MTQGTAIARVPLAHAEDRASSTGLTAPRFSAAVLLICLLLQRFALPAGGDLKISLATPLVLALAAWGLATGMLAIDRRRAGWFLALCAVACVSTLIHVNAPLGIAPRLSLTSLLYWLAITAFATLRFTQPMSEDFFFRLASACVAVVAVAGLAQFAGQFAGLRLFSFDGWVPDRFLLEDNYNVVIPLASGVLKSNGFFLVEPSVFSQCMAIGLAVEFLGPQRTGQLALFFAGLLSALSGTGWLVLGAFILTLGVTSGRRGVALAVGLAVGIVAMLALATLVLPDLGEALLGRAGELSEPGSSGYERFVTPFLAWRALLLADPWSFLTGVGPGASEQLTLPFFYTLNTPVKIIAEYGVFGLGFYLALIISGHRTRRQAMLLVPLLVLLLATGGYHQFAPVLFFVLLLGTVANLAPPKRSSI